MNLSTEQKQIDRHREQTCGCQGGWGMGDGWTGSLGLADVNFFFFNLFWLHQVLAAACGISSCGMQVSQLWHVNSELWHPRGI